MQQIFQSIITSSISPVSFLICTLVSAVLGFLIAITYTIICKRHTSGFVTTIALIPAVVQIVIMLVNGNLGAGVAVAGAFSLVRFRSIPGTAREICALFIALAVGLATGMGYIGFAVLFTVIMLVLCIIYSKAGLGEKEAKGKKSLQIVIPESINYTEVFNDIFENYTTFHETVSVKTTNMGSLYKITYEIRLKDESKEKEFLDAIRCRNGNLEVMCSKLSENQIIL